MVAARDLPEPDRSQRRAEIWNQALTQLVEREVVLQDAFARLEKAGGKKNVEKLTGEASEQFEKTVLRTWMKASGAKTEDVFRDYLKSQGVSLDMLRRQWERNFMAMEYLRSRVHPYTERIGPGQIREFYEKHPDDFQRPDSVKWQDLFVDAERHANRDEARRFAEALAERARGVEDFAKMAEQYDNGDSAFRKGEGIGTKHGEIKPPEAETTPLPNERRRGRGGRAGEGLPRRPRPQARVRRPGGVRREDAEADQGQAHRRDRASWR